MKAVGQVRLLPAISAQLIHGHGMLSGRISVGKSNSCQFRQKGISSGAWWRRHRNLTADERPSRRSPSVGTVHLNIRRRAWRFCPRRKEEAEPQAENTSQRSRSVPRRKVLGSGLEYPASESRPATRPARLSIHPSPVYSAQSRRGSLPEPAAIEPGRPGPRA